MKTSKTKNNAKIFSVFLAVIMLFTAFIQPSFFSAEAQVTSQMVDFGTSDILELKSYYIEVKNENDLGVYVDNATSHNMDGGYLEIANGDVTPHATVVLSDSDSLLAPGETAPGDLGLDTPNIDTTYINSGDTIIYVVELSQMMMYKEGSNTQDFEFVYRQGENDAPVYKVCDITFKTNVTNSLGVSKLSQGAWSSLHPNIVVPTVGEEFYYYTKNDMSVPYIDTEIGTVNKRVQEYEVSTVWYKGSTVDESNKVVAGETALPLTDYTVKVTIKLTDADIIFTPNATHVGFNSYTAGSSQNVLQDGKTFEIILNYKTPGDISEIIIDVQPPTVGMEAYSINYSAYPVTTPNMYGFILYSVWINNGDEPITIDDLFNSSSNAPSANIERIDPNDIIEDNKNYVYFFAIQTHASGEFEFNPTIKMQEGFKGIMEYLRLDPADPNSPYGVLIQFSADTLTPENENANADISKTRPADFSSQKKPMAIIPSSSQPLHLKFGSLDEDMYIVNVNTAVSQSEIVILKNYAKNNDIGNPVFIDISMELDPRMYMGVPMYIDPSVRLTGPIDVFVPNTMLGNFGAETGEFKIIHLKSDGTPEVLMGERVSGGVLIKGITNLSPFMIGNALEPIADTAVKTPAKETLPEDLSTETSPLISVPTTSLPKDESGNTIATEEIELLIDTNVLADDKAILEKYVTDNNLTGALYLDISMILVQTREKVQPSGPVEVFIPNSYLGDLVNATEEIKVLHLKDDGTVEVLTVTKVEGGIVFTASSFSAFAIAQVTVAQTVTPTPTITPTITPETTPTPAPSVSPNVPQTGDDFNLVLWGVTALISLAVITVFVRKKLAK